jgi:nitrogen fixation NifU-like protein
MADTFDFWQDHSERFLIMAYLHERNKEMAEPAGVASKTGDCGDTITIYLQIADNTIKEFSYQLQGCLNTNACCNALAEMVEGQPLDKCWQITPEDLINDLQTLPEDHFHCAELAVGTFYLALSLSKSHS